MKFFNILVLLISLDCFALTPINLELEKVNNQIKSQGLDLLELDEQNFSLWLQEFYVLLDKSERKKLGLNDIIENGFFPSNLSLNVNVEFKLSTISLIDSSFFFPWIRDSYEIVRGQNLYFGFTENRARKICFNSLQNRDLCQESFQGFLPDIQQTSDFPDDVEVAISEIKVPGICLVPKACVRDALSVKILAKLDNLDSILDYFSVGMDRGSVKLKLEQRLVHQTQAWIELQELFPGWLKDKVNTFPLRDDNEVCHGPARQFYNQILHNSAGYDRSTEATSILLKDYYCPIPDQNKPIFGDYMYVTGKHSGRFILKDPHSGRWISFSVQSGGAYPYRFWWSDEDFSVSPFGHKPALDFLDKVDVWRRCK